MFRSAVMRTSVMVMAAATVLILLYWRWMMGRGGPALPATAFCIGIFIFCLWLTVFVATAVRPSPKGFLIGIIATILCALAEVALFPAWFAV